MAERAGFEPAVPESTHALQACLIGHSSTSPCKDSFDILSIVKEYSSMDYTRDLSRKATYKDV